MNTIWTLIKIQFKAGIKVQHSGSKIKTAVKLTLLLALGAAALGGLIAIYYMLAKNFIHEKGSAIDLRNEFLTFTLVVFYAIQTLFLIPVLIKTMDLNNDRELLLKLPVSSKQIFLSKIAVVYMFELIFTAVILTPILIAFGFASGMAVGYFLLIPVLIVFVPVLPFFLAVIVMFPVMKLVRFLRGRSLLTIALYLVGLIGLIVCYMYLITGVIYAVADKGFAELLQGEKNVASIKNVEKFMYPARMFANLFDTSFQTVLINLALILVVSAVLSIIAFFIANAKYKKIYMDERVTFSSTKIKRYMRRENSTTAYLGKDVKNIFRSSNYTFQFLLVVVVTPLLIYFSNRIAGYSVYQALFNVQEQSQSNNMVFGVSILVSLILIPLSSAFAASNISREGHNIYHTKLIPVGFRKQLAIKVFIVFIPIFVSILISSFLTTLSFNMKGNVLPGLPIDEVMIVFFVSVLMAIGYICMGTYMDLRKPLCNQVGSGELTKTTAHTNTVMVVGICVGLLFGFLAMFSAFASVFNISFSLTVCKVIMLVFASVFAAVFAFLLFFDGPKRYQRLEQ